MGVYEQSLESRRTAKTLPMCAQTGTSSESPHSAMSARPILAVARLAGPVGAAVYVLSFLLPLTSTYSLIVLALGALIASLGTHVAVPPKRFNPIVWSILCFCIVSATSALLAVRTWPSLMSSVSLLPAMLLFMIISYDFSSLEQVRTLFLALTMVALGLSGALIGIALAHPIGAPSEWVTILDSPIIVVSNDATFFAALVPVFLALIYANPRSIGAAVGGLAMVSTLLVSIMLQSRTAVLTMFVCLLATAALRRSRPLVLMSIATPVVVVVMDVVLHAHLLAKFATRLIDTRLSLWWSAWKMFLDAPLLGHGPNTFGLLYPQYLSRLDPPAWLPVEPRVVPWPHNLYLEVLAERGLLGMLALAFLIGGGAMLAWRVRKVGCSEKRAIATTAFASLIGICFAGLLELTLLRLWVVVLLFVLLGVINLVSIRSLRAVTPSAKENNYAHT